VIDDPSVCQSVCHWLAVHKWLNGLTCYSGGDSCEPMKHCILWGLRLHGEGGEVDSAVAKLLWHPVV